MSGPGEFILRPEDVPPPQADRVLKFLNGARTAQEIAFRIERPDSDLGLGLAEELLAARQQLVCFRDLTELSRVSGLDPSHFTRLIIAIDGLAASICLDRFVWRGRISARIHGEKAKIGGVGAFAVDFVVAQINGRVRFRCLDDFLTVLDRYSWAKGPGKGGLQLPPELAPKARTIISQDFFAQIVNHFKVEDHSCEAESGGTCATVRLAGTLRITEGLQGHVERDPPGALEIGGKDGGATTEPCVIRASSAFEICCCTVEAENEKPAVCNWSSRCIDFNQEILEGEAPQLSGNLKMTWRLDGHVGGCGNVKWREDVKP